HPVRGAVPRCGSRRPRTEACSRCRPAGSWRPPCLLSPRWSRGMMTDMSETGNQDAGLLAHARARPDHIALREGDQERTYSELDDRARRVAHALASLGVRRGDRVAVMVPNSFEFFEAVHGAGRLGAVV